MNMSHKIFLSVLTVINLTLALPIILGNTIIAGQSAGLNTNLATANSGLDVFTAVMDAHDAALAVWPVSAALPVNPSGSVPFAFSLGGDMFAGDIYCLAETDYISVFPGANGCIYGKSVHGDRIGPIIYQSNKDINADGGIGGPGIVEWADRPNIDGASNQGYMDIWAWGNGSSDFSNSLNFGNRDSSGIAHRRFRIRNNGQVQFPDMIGNGNSVACFDANGDVYRGTATGC